jgi:hypothetical protein
MSSVAGNQLRIAEVATEPAHPDVRLAAVGEDVGGWCGRTFAEVLDAHPALAVDTGGEWELHLPDHPDAMEQLKEWEEIVLIPALRDATRRRLSAAGFAVLTQDEYLEVIEALRQSFVELAPDDRRVDVLRWWATTKQPHLEAELRHRRAGSWTR